MTDHPASSALSVLVHGAASYFDLALAALDEQDPEAGAAARKLAARGTLRVAVACAAGRGLWRVTLELTDAGGKTLTLDDRDLAAAEPPLQ